jgi:zinc/manganese transport system permease protein
MLSLMELKWMLTPFLACLVLSVNHVYLGIHVIERKVIFVDLALAQIAALGATYALILGYDPHADPMRVSLFSLVFTFVGAGAFAIARMRKERVPQEAFIGIIYAAASAAAILILSKSPTGGEDLKHMLVGDVLLVSMRSVGEMALLYGTIGIFHFLFRKKFLAISMNAEETEASGINIRFWDVLFYMSFGVVITKSVQIVGVLLVFSYLVVPAVIAQMWSGTVRGRLLFGWFIAILASTLGILWSFHSDYPTGPAVVVMLSVLLIAASIAYYVVHAQRRLRAVTNVALLALFGFFFISGLDYFRKPVHDGLAVKRSPVDLLLEELKDEDEAHQLDAVRHLGDIHDVKIVPALVDVLERTSSELVVEATVEALAKQRDPRAIPALQSLTRKEYDDFLMLTIARAQLAVGDREGLLTLVRILQNDEAGFARHQAVALLESATGKDFGYDAEKTVAENAAALQRIEDWRREHGKDEQ